MVLSVAFIKHSSTLMCKGVQCGLVMWFWCYWYCGPGFHLPFWVFFILVAYIIFSDIGLDQLVDQISLNFDIG